MQPKIPLFSLNVSFCRMSPLKVNRDVIRRFMTSQYATSRKWVLHVNGSPTHMTVKMNIFRCYFSYFYSKHRGGGGSGWGGGGVRVDGNGELKLL